MSVCAQVEYRQTETIWLHRNGWQFPKTSRVHLHLFLNPSSKVVKSSLLCTINLVNSDRLVSGFFWQVPHADTTPGSSSTHSHQQHANNIVICSYVTSTVRQRCRLQVRSLLLIKQTFNLSSNLLLHSSSGDEVHTPFHISCDVLPVTSETLREACLLHLRSDK